jgi:tetratricopeptide (TPR) repeat protein
MVYSMDVDQQVHRARDLDFDKEGDNEVLSRSTPHKLTGLDLAEARLASGDVAAASAMARQALAASAASPDAANSLDAIANGARADFILARVAILTGHPDQAVDEFQKTLAASKNPRLISWSHIYLGRMLDLDCKRDEALTEYQEALKTRDGQQDTRLAAERGVKTAYAVKGHSCDEDADNDAPPAATGPAPVKPQPEKPEASWPNGSENPK